MRVFPINLFWIVSRRQLVALLLVLNYPDVRNSREKVLVLGHTSKQSPSWRTVRAAGAQSVCSRVPSWWTVRAAGAQDICSHVMSMSGKGDNEHICTCAQLTTPFLYSPGSLPGKWCHPQWARPPTPTSAVKTAPHRGSQRHFSQFSPNSVNLTANTALHTCLEALLLCTSRLFPADSIGHHKLFKARHDW